MSLAGFRFQVLSPIFLVHWGLQTRENREGAGETRESQIKINNKFMENVFIKEMIKKWCLKIIR